jgi:succinate dehydrogenase flavin-adding protein (antitoxin of CptAB toxin-antitoxin module)
MEAWHRKMRFACKRGTLESETLLQYFLTHPESLSLDELQQKTFESLLDIDDTTLMNALMNGDRSTLNQQQLKMCQLIRQVYLPQ